MKYFMVLNIYVNLLIIVGLNSLCVESLIAQEGRIIPFPQVLTVHEGQYFEVVFFVDPGAEPVSVVDMYISYDPMVIKAIQVHKSEEGPLNLNQVEPQVEEESGHVLYGAFKLHRPWPEESFELVRVRFEAIKAVLSTKISHVVEGNKKTILAYAGYNTLQFAPDVDLRILSDEDNNQSESTMSIVPKITVHKTKNKLNLHIKNTDTGLMYLALKSSDAGFEKPIYNSVCQTDNEYVFEIDMSVLPFGNYEVIAEVGGKVYSRKLSHQDG